MRTIAGLLLTVTAIAVAAPALSQPRHLTPAQRALLDDVFASKPAKLRRDTSGVAAAPLAARHAQHLALAPTGAFALPQVTGSGLDQQHLVNPDRLIAGQGLAVWRTNEVSFPVHGGAVDTVRVSVGGVARGRGGVVFARPDSLMPPDAETFDVSYTRGWPSAWSLTTGRYDLDISPHAGVGFGDNGGSAEAGALVRFGRNLQDRVVRRLGLTASGPSGDGHGSLFLFAAASGRAVGMSVAPSATGGLQRSGWMGESATGLVSDAQAGVGWRLGEMQASLGYVHRSVKNEAQIMTGAGPANYHDSMVALSFSFIPR